MTNDPSEIEPIESLFRFLESDLNDLTEAQLEQELTQRGLDPAATTSAVSAMVGGYLKGRRLSWKDAARQKQAALHAAAARTVSWANRKREEIEAAFEQARQGTYGSATQMKLQAAFRNLINIPTEDKASFLDEIETLQHLNELQPPPSEADE